jgi:cell wall-associated NlpC family hydrolase
MRPPHRSLKERTPPADHRTMAPGGSTRRARPSIVLAVVAALTTTLLQAPVASARDAKPADYTAGEAGTGLPPVPIEQPPIAAKQAPIAWKDVTSSHSWARTAIDHVAGARDWMRDYKQLADGTYPFKPDKLESRRHFARAVVRAFAPGAVPDPSIVFTDLDPTSNFWRFANVAAARGWLPRTPDGRFRPDEPVTMTQVHRALVLALGLRPAVRALNRIRTAGGVKIRVPGHFGTTALGMRLNLRYPSKYEDNDVHPWTPMPRVQVAYSLWRATTQASWTVTNLLQQHKDVVLPRMGPARRAIVEWGARYVGYPYVWGGEWGLRSPAPAALGGQNIPGFDCSGFTWWVMRRNDSYAWKVAPPRPYAGWSLPERSSAMMAAGTTTRLTYQQLKPGDLMFYDGDRNGVTDHVDVYAGNGWALDSSNSPAGVTLMWVGSGWYRDHFLFGRRIMPG